MRAASWDVLMGAQASGARHLAKARASETSRLRAPRTTERATRRPASVVDRRAGEVVRVELPAAVAFGERVHPRAVEQRRGEVAASLQRAAQVLVAVVEALQPDLRP